MLGISNPLERLPTDGQRRMCLDVPTSHVPREVGPCPLASSGRAQRLDGRRLNEVRDRFRQMAVGGDERVGLQPRQRHELGVVRPLPPQLLSDPPRRALEHLSPRKRTFSEFIRVSRSIPSAADSSPRRYASYSADNACDRTSVGATSWCSAATSISPAATRGRVSQSTTNRVTTTTLHGHERLPERRAPERPALSPSMPGDSAAGAQRFALTLFDARRRPPAS